MTVCPNCDANDDADRGDDPWAVARLQTGYVKLAPTQYYWGATFFVAKACVRELHELSTPDRQSHLMEMSEVAEAVFHAFAPRKLNYEALGNSVPHLHWWLTPGTPTTLDRPNRSGKTWTSCAHCGPGRCAQMTRNVTSSSAASSRRSSNEK